jgi:hypothetical protein
MATLMDMVRDVRDSLQSYVQVKDKQMYLASDANGTQDTLILTDARGAHAGMVLELSNDDTTVSEMVRVKAVSLNTNTVTVVRGVRGTTAAAWLSATTDVRVEPDYPVSAIVRAINQEITGLPPHIWSIATLSTTVDDTWRFGYQLPDTAVGVLSVRYEPIGYEGDAFEAVRRWRFDPVNKIVSVLNLMDPGANLKITYRKYPTALSAPSDDLADAGLEDSLAELIAMGATYRLVAKRAPGRLIDKAAQTPLNGEYRQADPVNAAVRQLYAMYQERLSAERERQRLLYPIPLHMTF